MARPPYRIQTPGRPLKFRTQILGVAALCCACNFGQGQDSSTIPKVEINPNLGSAEAAPIEPASPETPEVLTEAEEEKKKNAPPAVSDPIAMRIADNYVNALGGEAAILRTKNIVIRAKEVSGQDEFDTLIFRTAAGKTRVERTGFYGGRPSEFHWISDAEQFWSVNYYRDRELVQWFKDKEMKAFLFEQSLYPHLLQHRERGIKLKYLGTEEHNGVEHYAIRAFFPNGTRMEYVLNPQNFLPFQYRFRTKYGGKTGFRIITPTRYKRIEGALWELDTKIHFGELPMGSFTIDRVEGNQPLPPSLFEAPDRKKAISGAVPDQR